MQDAIAILIVAAAGLWLGRHLLRRLVAPPCQPPPGGPAGSDGFISLEQVQQTGRPQSRQSENQA